MKKGYRNIAFLAELLINILVFSISCAVLAGVFGKAGIMAKHTREESAASAEASALLEIVRLRGLDGLENGQRASDGLVVCHYDENWQPVQAGGAYTLEISAVGEDTGAGVLLRLAASGTVVQDGRPLCRLETAVYLPGEGGAA